VSPASSPLTRTRIFVISLIVTAMLMLSAAPVFADAKKAPPPPPECPVVAAILGLPVVGPVVGAVVTTAAGLPVVGPVVAAVCI
jgi:hypothetical protein